MASDFKIWQSTNCIHLMFFLYSSTSESCFTYYFQKKPGLSSYAENPIKAAESLKDLLEKAENVVPFELRHKTPIRVGVIHVLLHCIFGHHNNLDYDVYIHM